MVKICVQKTVKTWWKSVEEKEVMKLWSFTNFHEAFLWNSDMNMQMSELMMSSASLLAIYFVYKI